MWLLDTGATWLPDSDHHRWLHTVLDDLSPHENLLAAVIIQAAGDFVDAYQAGLIGRDMTVSVDAMREMINANRARRCRFPKWMDATDVQSAVIFLFDGDYLEQMIPARWHVDADAIRVAVITSARNGRRISSYFSYAY